MRDKKKDGKKGGGRKREKEKKGVAFDFSLVNSRSLFMLNDPIFFFSLKALGIQLSCLLSINCKFNI